MIVTNRTDLGHDVDPCVRVFHTVQVACDRCRKRFPAKEVNAPYTDGSEWDAQFQRLCLIRKYKLTERIEGHMRVDLCRKCLAKTQTVAS